MTLEEIMAQSPVIRGRGEKTVFYSVACCWWTSFNDDLGKVHAPGHPERKGHIPGCPHCGSPLMEGNLERFIECAKENPEHYGPGGMETFVAAHERNAHACHPQWCAYEES